MYIFGLCGMVLCVVVMLGGVCVQFVVVFVIGNCVLFVGVVGEVLVVVLLVLLKVYVVVCKQVDVLFDVVLFEGDSDELQMFVKDVVQWLGLIVLVQGVLVGVFENGDVEDYVFEWLLMECLVSVNMVVVGGNVNLMMIG